MAAVQKVHARIAEAILAGDPDAAERLMRKHPEVFQSLTEKRRRLDEPITPRSRWIDWTGPLRNRPRTR